MVQTPRRGAAVVGHRRPVVEVVARMATAKNPPTRRTSCPVQSAEIRAHTSKHLSARRGSSSVKNAITSSWSSARWTRRKPSRTQRPRVNGSHRHRPRRSWNIWTGTWSVRNLPRRCYRLRCTITTSESTTISRHRPAPEPSPDHSKSMPCPAAVTCCTSPASVTP
uniref:(northern house mosquito) hypothetical protein n=2 Tax=Culex pipiens TaxID=7175 RepID=A0A8D8NN67_CULPI